MQTRTGDSRLLWLAVGLVAGLAIASYWPHEPVAAATSDRSSKFGMLTTPVGGGAEGVFVLDFLTGRLTGGVLDTSSGKFQYAYYANVAVDFGVDPKVTPQYAFVGGQALLSGRRGITPAASVIYVGELSSGRVIAYGFDYKRASRKVGIRKPLVKLDGFQFREAALK